MRSYMYISLCATMYQLLTKHKAKWTFQILSRYDIVLVQEIRDSSQIYISLLVDEINQFTYV